jgi:hypothetical protein
MCLVRYHLSKESEKSHLIFDKTGGNDISLNENKQNKVLTSFTIVLIT